MKTTLVLLALLIFASLFRESRIGMISHSWKLVGARPFGKPYRPSPIPQEEVLILKDDGTFERVLYGQLHITGVWKFNPDSTKLLYSIKMMGGAPVQDMSLDQGKPTDSIMVLTQDSLVIAQLAYYGSNKVYGHDDKVYVRVP